LHSPQLDFLAKLDVWAVSSLLIEHDRVGADIREQG